MYFRAVMSTVEINKAMENAAITFEEFKEEIINDYKLAVTSREISLLGRKEVLSGKAKFGIFGDGKELPQIALAKAFEAGDWRSGYYRDQTWMMAIGELTVQQFFSQLYAHPDQHFDVFSAGRQMNGHFATRTFDEKTGEWLPLAKLKNSSADASPTASQMPRSLGLALASKLFRKLAIDGEDAENLSTNGREVSFVSIGDASTSEGLFWETINAAGVLKVPLAVCVWDDGYGISVPKKFQTTKGSISAVLSGFQTNENGEGIDIYVCEGWNYPKLVATFKKGIAKMRETHRAALFHITELTQPQGHSTSGSHERYKSSERLQFEKDFDGIKKFKEWILENEIATIEELTDIEQTAKTTVNAEKNAAWKAFSSVVKNEMDEFTDLANQLNDDFVSNQIQQLKATLDPIRKDIIKTASSILLYYKNTENIELAALKQWLSDFKAKYQTVYSSHLYSESPYNAMQVKTVAPEYGAQSEIINGYEVMNRFFDHTFATEKYVLAFGEDVGQIGDVNQGFSGLQERYGKYRIADAGIREATIMGQAIGLSLRGFRPIAEIQYLDYLLYGLQPLADDVACLQYRTCGLQRMPLIVRTRGHRLEGIWHTGSPMGMIINSLRGMYICVPRNMVQAAGMYRTLLQSDEPGLVIECLNGYRLKEKLPLNFEAYTVPMGIPEILEEGEDVTLVTYGSCIRIAQEAIAKLKTVGISVELIDVQTLLPFDINGMIRHSIAKTNRVVFLDEDVPGGASAYMFQQVFENQQIFRLLDAPPKTIAAQPHRAAYGSDGDYFSKPNTEDVFDTIYAIMNEADPDSFPLFK